VTIEVENISKKYNNNFIFKNLSYSFLSDKPVAIIGANGSGKSTLIKILAGILTPDEGKIIYRNNNVFIPEKEIYKFIAFLSPYSELVEEFTLFQIIEFNAKFSSFQKKLSTLDIIDMMNFSKYKNVLIKNFSSGMKQKLKIALCIFFKKYFLFFDEPCSNLDPPSKAWYRQIISEYLDNRLLIIASNSDEDETFYCTEKINIQNYHTPD